MSSTNTRTPRLVSLVAAIAIAMTAVVALPVASAQAMTCDKATARSNEDGGNGVIGGMTTRLTWEGTTAEGESVDKVTLELPAGGSFDGSSTRVTVLDGLTRIAVEATTSENGSTLEVDFSQPVPAASLVRIEVTDMVFPAEGGDYSVGGTFESAGASQALPDSPAITIIANTPLQAIVGWLDDQAWVEAWNSNTFLNMFFKPQLLVTSFASLAPGWLVCLVIILLAYPIAIVLGLAFAFMKMSRHRLVRAIAVTYINVLRGTPLFLQIYIMFFGLPMVGVNIDNNVLGVIVMAVNSSSYLAEIFRAGIQSIPQGQYEAAASLGMNRVQTMVSIILPQTVRRVIPTVTSDFITGYKDTSLLSSVGVMELMMFSKNLTATSGNITPYMAAAIYYLIVTLPLIKAVSLVEKRLARNESGSGPRPKAQSGSSSEEGESDLMAAEMGVHMQAAPAADTPLRSLTAPFRCARSQEMEA